MGQYEVCITDEALSDMESIYDYISYSLQAPETAKGQYDRIANAILTLETFPKNFLCLVVNLRKHGNSER